MTNQKVDGKLLKYN